MDNRKNLSTASYAWNENKIPQERKISKSLFHLSYDIYSYPKKETVTKNINHFAMVIESKQEVRFQVSVASNA